MSHLIILDKNNKLAKSAVAGNERLNNIHEAIEQLDPETDETLIGTVGTKMDILQDFVTDTQSDYIGQLASIEQDLGIAYTPSE